MAPAEIIVMFRGDHHGVFSRPVKDALAAIEIPVFDPAFVEETMGEGNNRLAVLLLRLLANPGDSLAWAGLLCLTPGVGDKFQWAIYNRAVDARVTFADALLSSHAEGFPETPSASRSRASDAVTMTLEWLERHDVPEEPEEAWGTWIVEAFSEDPPVELSGDLIGLLTDVDGVVEEGTTLGRYMGLLQPLAKDQMQARAGGVRFMSMSMSKGLTVTAAIIGGAEDGLVPRPDADVAEERRLMYVAMTRARRYQFVTWATRRTGPTARSGEPRVQTRRSVSRFLRNGPIESQDGETFIADRW